MVFGDSVLRSVGAEYAHMTVECFPGIETEQLHTVIEKRDLGSPETRRVPYITGHSSQHNIKQHGMLPQYPTGTAKLM